MAKVVGGDSRRARTTRNSAHSQLEKVIFDLLSNRFEQSAISAVRIKDDVDSDGDKVLRIIVVLSGDRELNGKQLVGFVRHLRSHMQGTEFPIVSFVSEADADKLEFEAA